MAVLLGFLWDSIGILMGFFVVGLWQMDEIEMRKNNKPFSGVQ